MGGRSSECSSGEEDGDAEWKAAISSVAASTSSSSSLACVPSFINGFSAASNHSTTPQNTHNDDDGDGGGLHKQKPQQLKHYQLKVSGFRAKRCVLVPSFFITLMSCGKLFFWGENLVPKRKKKEPAISIRLKDSVFTRKVVSSLHMLE